MIRFTPGQLREALGLSKETFRYWKHEFPLLTPKQGSRACYGPAELLSTAVIKQLVELGLPVSRIRPIAPSVHKQCRSSGWLWLERQVMVIQLESSEASFSAAVHTSPTSPVLCIPLAPTIARLRAHLMTDDDLVEQRNLTFSPMSVSGGAHS